jgi:diguanylate cyclase (GGDEF)-like protein/PAS domain S-box-containing protein
MIARRSKATWFFKMLETGVRQNKLTPRTVSWAAFGIVSIVSVLAALLSLQGWEKAEQQTLNRDIGQVLTTLKSQPTDPPTALSSPALKTLTHALKLSLKTYSSNQIPLELASTYQNLNQSSPTTLELKATNWGKPLGYALLRNTQNKPIALLEVKRDRILFHHGVLNTGAITLLLGVSGTTLILGIYALLERSKQLMAERETVTLSLLQEQEFALITLQSIQEAVITTDAKGLIKTLNPVAEKITGWSAEAAVGLPLEDVFSVEDDDYTVFVKLPLTEVLNDGVALSGSPEGSHSLISRDGKRTSIDYTVTRILDQGNQVKGVVVVFRDVTTHRNMARLLAWQANFDALTGLVNRREFERRLEQAVQDATANQGEHSLCFIDLDHFKAVNDNAGHPAGDELLRQISSLIRQYFRRADLVARLGGDEFGAILYHCSLAKAEAIAKEVCRRVNEYRFVWQDQTFRVGASIGLVAITAESSESNQLFNLVDAACYAAKNQGRGRVCIYQPSMQEINKQKGEIQWVQRINRALAKDQFSLFSQVIAPLNPEARKGGDFYEVLLRMLDEQGNLLLPNRFLPAAERYNLMSAIDQWVIARLFSAQAQYFQESWNRWQTEGIESLYTINLSAASVSDPEFTKFLLGQFKLYNIPAPLICFEVKETVAVANLARMKQFVESLKSIGCRFALDDFGSGMSSFGYLKNLPIDYLKIDGSLIRDIDNPSTFATIESINRISRVMEMKTIAEFVTSTGIANRCAAAGIDYAQGFGIGRPKSLVDAAYHTELSLPSVA